jgi:hypothetical protein
MHSTAGNFRGAARHRLVASALVCAGAAIVLGGCQVPVAAPTAVTSHLYSTDAGFTRGSTIAVQSVADPNVAIAVAWWNARAGRPLFNLTNSGPLQVTIQSDPGTCADVPIVACTAAFPTSGSFASPPAYPYNSCAIYIKAPGQTDWRVYAHELGHCLGFGHVTERVSIMNPAPDANNPSADQAMLQLAGY